MMLSLSTPSAHPNGNVIIDAFSDSSLKERVLRISRTKTLDGGVYINNFGFCHGDRTLAVKARITEAQEVVLTLLTELYTRVVVSMDDGVYLAAVSHMVPDNGELSMTLLIEKKESQ